MEISVMEALEEAHTLLGRASLREHLLNKQIAARDDVIEKLRNRIIELEGDSDVDSE